MKKQITLFLIFIFILPLWLSAKNENSTSDIGQTVPSKKKYLTIESVVTANIEFLIKEDLDGYMSTLHPKCPDYAYVPSTLKNFFETYNIDYKIEKMQILKKNKNEAQVRVTQLTTKISGPEFRNNRAILLHTLKRDGISWKFYSTVIEKVEYLDEK